MNSERTGAGGGGEGRSPFPDKNLVSQLRVKGGEEIGGREKKGGESETAFLTGNGERFSSSPLLHMPRTEGFASRRTYVRYMATSRPAIAMDRALRREAAADPGLTWDPEAHRYRRASKAAPAPSPPKGEPAAGEGGGSKVFDPSLSRPAGAHGKIANTQNGSR
jgi:hypothetical protein